VFVVSHGRAELLAHRERARPDLEASLVPSVFCVQRSVRPRAGRALVAISADEVQSDVAPGGAAVLYVGPSADAEAVGRVAEQLAAGRPEISEGLLVVAKLGPTPPGFPRRPGVARKRPLA